VSETAGPLPAARWRVWLPRLGPVVITAAVLVVIARRYSPAEVATAMREGHALAIVPWAVVQVVGYLALLAAADGLVLRPFGAPPYTDVLRGRAAAAVLSSFTYLLGVGGYGAWIARRTGVGAPVASGIVVYTLVSDLAALGVVALCVIPFASESVSRGLFGVAFAITAGPVLLVLVGPHLRRLRTVDFARPWAEVHAGPALAQIVLRALGLAFAATATSMAARAFGLEIPLAALAVGTPLLIVVASLPVNVAGLGAAQGAWLLFFLPYETGPRILAFQLLWTCALGVSIILRGLPFLRRALAQITAPERR
jgi:hypothetical protein